MGLAQFDQSGSLDDWTSHQERLWQAEAIPHSLLSSRSSTAVYALGPYGGQMYLTAYTVNQGQLLVVPLTGYGSYASKAALVKSGLLDDLITMTSSAKALQAAGTSADSTSVVPDSDTGESGPALYQDPGTLTTDSFARRERSGYYGTYHCHGSVCGYDFWTEQVVKWDQGTRTIGELYESFWYRHSNLRGEWLFSTHVNDYPDWCSGGHPDYISRAIGKQTSSSHFQVGDDWYPNYRNSKIGSQTYHGMITGDPGIFDCTAWRPFYLTP